MSIRFLFLCNGFGIGEDLYLNFVILQIVDKREFRDVTYQDYVGFLIYFAYILNRVRRVGFFNFGSVRVRVLKKYFGSGWVSGICIKYQVNWVLLGRFPIFSNIYYLI